MKKRKINFTIASIVIFILLGILIAVSSIFIKQTFARIIYLIISLTMMCLFIITFILFVFAPKKELHRIDDRLSFYISHVIAKNGVGAIMLSDKNRIIWASEFIKNRFGDDIIGKTFILFHQDIKIMFHNSETKTTIENKGYFYKIYYHPNEKIAVVKDISIRNKAIQRYESEKIVLGEIDIDNFQLFQSTLPEEELFKLQASVIGVLEKIVKKYNLSYRQYVNGKFFLITNEENFQKIFDTKFSFLNELRKEIFTENVTVTLSIGFARGSEITGELMEMAKDALRQSQARGGDQVSIYTKNKPPKYLGSKSELAINQSRTKNKNLADSFKKSLENPNINNVIVYGHKYSDLDAIGAAYAVVEIAKYYGKEAFIQNVTFDDTCKESKALYLSEQSHLFIDAAKANTLTTKNSVVVIVDTAEESRVENVLVLSKTKAIKENIFIIDHHRVSELPKFLPIKNYHIDTSASSASEMVTEIIAFLGLSKAISKTAAQMLLNGIYLDTNKFQKATSNKTFGAASLLESWGAKASESIEVLKMRETDSKLVQKIISNLQEIKKGYFLAAYDGEVPGNVVSIAADEILRIRGRRAAFVIARVPNSQNYKMSARGIETNVQIIAENVGGGGHFGAAAAVTSENIEIFTDNIIQAIVSVSDESNFN